MWFPKVEEKHYYCYRCRHEIEMIAKLQRTDTCPHCGVDMHCCKNCQYWDVSAHNQCSEHIAEYIPDREKANFCTFFTFRDGQPEDQSSQVQDAKARLENLFGKRS